jgi:hypothetical protein
MKKLKPFIFFLSCLGLVALNNNCQKDREDLNPKPPDNEKKSVLDISPPGEYVQNSEQPVNTLESFSSQDKLVATYYFYWYDITTNAHIIDSDGSDALTDHPANMQNFSYKDVSWHKQELLDMIDAGIDIVLPVYWGDTGNLSWSVPGIEKLVEAWQSLKAEGINPPKIGMFYDTSSLQLEHVLKEPERPDLTTDFGKEYFYKLIRDFFSLVPPELRARIDGKPYVQLYSAAFSNKHDQSTFNFADQHFSMDFGGNDLYIVREVSWTNATSENLYAWGAALRGINAYGAISIGPGYDDRAVPGRTTPVRDRENGQFYIDNWIKALVIGSLDKTMNIVIIETWNEFHEGTDIAHSREYGRTYIDITSEYAARFKNGEMPTEDFPGKEFLNADSVYIEFGEKGDTHGITHVEPSDGETTVTMVEDIPCLQPVKTDYGGMYMYFAINYFFKMGRKDPVYVIKVEYYDSENTGFTLQYDSKDETAPLNGAYKSLSGVNTTGTNRWKTASFEVTDARFVNRQNGGADFRLEAKTTNLYIKRVCVEIINQE